MASRGMPRNRGAPGSSPAQNSTPMQMPNNSFSNGIGSQLSDDQFLQWGEAPQARNTYPNPPLPWGYTPNTLPQGQNQASTQLTRRPASQMTTRARTANRTNDEAWLDMPDEPTTGSDNPSEDDLEELLRKAQIVKKESLAKRKGIPPFVQKLNRFLENDTDNAHLIRWSDDGNSFIVINEDEFAKTLIPELFKHNNYASFVRQLNMYGFHKKVGLTDNSLRQSENQNKSPSVYSNPYFRRGHPDLLWLIHKPKNTGTSTKKTRTRTEMDSNNEEVNGHTENGRNSRDGSTRRRPQLTLGHGESTLTQEQLQNIQRELATVRNQQRQITSMIQTLNHEHQQLIQQVAAYREQNTRNDNSINAILTFLATVYNRSVQGHEGVPGIANLFAGSIPHEHQGNVVDVGNYNFDNLNHVNGRLEQPFKRQPLLLTNGQDRRATSTANSPLTSRQTRRTSYNHRGGQTPLPINVEEVYDSNSPAATNNNLGDNSTQTQNDMMSVIQNTNARNSQPGTPIAEFSNMLNSLDNSAGNTPLTNAQRTNVLRMVNNSTRQSNDLENLARLQAEQDRSVQNLTNLLQPLSPTGSIPGIGDGQNLPPPPLDIDDFLNHNEYFADFPSDVNGNSDLVGDENANTGTDFNFPDYNDNDEMFGNLPASNVQPVHDEASSPNDGSDVDETEGGRVESLTTSEATTPSSSNANTIQGPTTRSRGRQLSLVNGADRDDPSAKRVRRF